VSSECQACSSGGDTIYSQTELFLWECLSFVDLLRSGVIILTDSVELRGDLQLNVLISNDYVWTQTMNGLVLFMERELTLVLILGVKANVH